MCKTYPLLFSILIIVIFLSCFGSKSGLIRNYDSQIANPINIPQLIIDANNFDHGSNTSSYTILKKIVMEQTEDKKIYIDVHQITKVLRKDETVIKALQSLPYNKNTTIITYFKISVTDRHGNIDTFEDSKDFVPFLKFPAYNHIVTKVIKLPVIKPGSLIEVKYQLIKHTQEINSGLSDHFIISSSIPTYRFRGVIIIPEGLQLHYKSLNTNIKPQIINRDDKKIYIFDKYKCEKLTIEKYQLPLSERQKKIVFSINMHNKQIINDYFNKSLVKLLDKPAITIKMKVKELIRGLNSPEAKLTAINKFIQHKINNVPITFGTIGYTFETPVSVFENGYGSAKDKAILLLKMLREAKIDANFCLVPLTRDIDHDITIMNEINNVLVCVKINDKKTFIDPMSYLFRSGQLPADLYGKEILIIGKKPLLYRLEIPSALENTMSYSSKTCINLDGSLEVVTTFNPSGVFEPSERMKFLTTTDKEDLKKYFSFKLGIDIQKIEFIEPLNLSKQFNYVIKYRKKDYYPETELNTKGWIVFHPNIHSKPINKPSNIRRSELYLGSYTPFREIVRNRVILPDNLKIINLPQNQKIRNRLWEYQVAYRKTNNGFDYIRTYSLKKRIIQKKYYNKFISFLNTISKYDRQLVKIKKKNE